MRYVQTIYSLITLRSVTRRGLPKKFHVSPFLKTCSLVANRRRNPIMKQLVAKSHASGHTSCPSNSCSPNPSQGIQYDEDLPSLHTRDLDVFFIGCGFAQGPDSTPIIQQGLSH